MPEYRRVKDGRTFFFTVVTFNRQRFLCLKESRIVLRRVIEEIRLLQPFEINAWVLMPDHIHCIWSLPEDDVDYFKRWGLIKSRFTKIAGKRLVATTILQNHGWERGKGLFGKGVFGNTKFVMKKITKFTVIISIIIR